MVMTRPRGNSETAQYLSQENQAKEQYFKNSAVLSKQSAFDELAKVFEECNIANWDGYNALPVKSKTFFYTYKFIEALPLGYSLPSVGVEPDGHLTLEWYQQPQWTISISIDPESTLYYAALFGSEDVRGSETFSGEISQHLFALIQRANIA